MTFPFMTAPGGDPDALYSLVTELKTAAAGASGLGQDTPATMDSIQKQANWTGQAATASMNLSGDLGDGVAGTSAPLLTIAAKVYSFAGALATAQAKVAAYNRSVSDAEAGQWADAAANAAMRTAASTASSALSAYQQAGDQAASKIASATKQLGGVFAAGKPVRTYLASLPAEINPYAASSSTGTALVTGGLPLASDFTLPASDAPAPPSATGNQPFGYLFREPLAAQGEPVSMPVYDPLAQVNRVDGELPTRTIDGMPTQLRQRKTFPTEVTLDDGTVVRIDKDPVDDAVPDPGPA